MRNRAKCKICRQIIESKSIHDYVTCPCGEISLDGGTESFKCIAKDFDNFLRIDEDDNEIPVRLVNKNQHKEEQKEETKEVMNREEIMTLFDNMIENIQSMPEKVMSLPISHYDHVSLMLIIRSLFRAS